MGVTSAFVESFLARTEPSPDGCVVWTAGRASDGRYGTCWFDGRNRKAHVVAYLVFVGEYDASLELDHTCGVTLCVNPEHLDPVTHRENVLRGNAPPAINARKTKCIRGHDLSDPANVRATDGRRTCLVCVRARQNGEYHRKRAAMGFDSRPRIHPDVAA